MSVSLTVFPLLPQQSAVVLRLITSIHNAGYTLRNPGDCDEVKHIVK